MQPKDSLNSNYFMRDINELENTCLDYIQENLEEDISNYEIISSENLYDDETDIVYRGYTFNRGNEEYKIAISPSGLIKCVSEDIPNNLIIDISNSLIYMLNSLYYEMLIDVSNRRKPKKKPEEIIEELIKNLYTKTK